MKKIFAIILALTVLFSISIPVSAAVISPENPVTYIVTCYGVKGASNGSQTSVAKGNTITVSSDSARGDFTKWEIQGNFEMISGTITSGTINVKPLSDITITGKYTSSSTPADTTKPTDTNKNGKYDVHVISGKGVNGNGEQDATWEKNKATISFDAEKNNLTAEADDSLGKFDSWSVYHVTYDKNGKKNYTEAVEGVHYKFVTTGADPLHQRTITIIPLGDLVICGNYNGKVTSPKTSDYSVYFAVIALFALAGIAVTTKKILSK